VNIGEAAAASGVTSKMFRYYESFNLTPAVRRSANGYRVYSPADVHTLAFICRARTLGFSVRQIEALVGLWQNKDRASSEVKAIAEDHIASLNTKIEELQAMARTLQHLAQSCHGDDRPGCPIIEGLAHGPGTARHG
jgi:MerR family copper efflux transcriptional regulator